MSLIHEPDAMASLSAYLPAEVTSAAYEWIDAMARKLKLRTEQRTMDQLRADVTADLLLGKDNGGVSAQVFVHVPIDATLSINDRG